MSVLSWNCRGLGSPSTGRNLRFLCNKYKPSLVFLMETRVNNGTVERRRRGLRFPNMYYVEPEGISGGLALWWLESVKVEVIVAGKNFIHVKILAGLDPIEGHITFVYGPPKEQLRGSWW